MHRILPLALIALTACRSESPEPSAPVSKGVPERALRMARAMGLDAWRGLGRLGFTWKHIPKGLVRSYEWRPRESTVEVRVGTTADGQTSRTVTSGPLGADAAEDDRKLHRAWINDSYWFLFPLLILDDGSEIKDLGPQPVPGFPGLEGTHALDVRYPAEEGYTGGDRYVLYIGADDLPVAWAFHRKGAAEPTLVCTRGARRRVNGISLPTRFEKADGGLLIEIAGATAEPAR
ncbi:MAG: hypothetical protein ACYTHK_00830 [Planctomycetota bacterium]|jgi:hypothetical protein